jgi:hypothetical protein
MRSERGVIVYIPRKTTLDFGGEKYDKITVLTKEQKEIIEKLGFADRLFGL